MNRETYICVPCRRTNKAMRCGTAVNIGSITCTECGTPMRYMGRNWRPPRRSNWRAWRRIAAGDFLTELPARMPERKHGRIQRFVKGRRVGLDVRMKP
jgi:hypothetical protein